MFGEPQSVDAFHRGRFVLVQPVSGGHRAGTDALLLAACVPADFSGHVADFGAGAGAVGLAVVSRCPKATALLVERSPEMAAFARLTLDHPANVALAERLELALADVELTGRARRAAGLGDRSSDFVVMNPPFNDRSDKTATDTLRREAHVASAGIFERWLRSAAAVARPGGRVALIFRPASIGQVLDALTGRFGRAEIVPVHSTAERPAIRVIVRAVKGARAGPSFLKPLVLHEGDANRFARFAEAISDGNAALFTD